MSTGAEREARAKQAAQRIAAEAATAGCIEYLGPGAPACGVVGGAVAGAAWDIGRGLVSSAGDAIGDFFSGGGGETTCNGPECAVPPPLVLWEQARAMGLQEPQIAFAVHRANVRIADAIKQTPLLTEAFFDTNVPNLAAGTVRRLWQSYEILGLIASTTYERELALEDVTPPVPASSSTGPSLLGLALVAVGSFVVARLVRGKSITPLLFI